jgi:hypothetical protein
MREAVVRAGIVELSEAVAGCDDVGGAEDGRVGESEEDRLEDMEIGRNKCPGIWS